MAIFYKKWKKYNEFQLTKNKMDLNIRKMTNHPPSPADYFIFVFSKDLINDLVSGGKFYINSLSHFKIYYYRRFE